MARLSQESLVETDDARSITRGDGPPQKLAPGAVVVRVLFRKPLAEPGVPIYFVPVRNGLIQRPLDVSPLAPLSHLPQLLILRPQLLEPGLKSIGSSPTSDVKEFGAVIFFILTSEHISQRLRSCLHDHGTNRGFAPWVTTSSPVAASL